jgi:hypothetical protein
MAKCRFILLAYANKFGLSTGCFAKRSINMWAWKYAAAGPALEAWAFKIFISGPAVIFLFEPEGIVSNRVRHVRLR